MEFSNAILKNDRAAGLITMLNKDGTPKVDPNSNLSGLKIVDVNGWAPTEDGLGMVTNSCTGEKFIGYEVITPPTAKNANDAAMKMLRDGKADAMWIYAD